MVDERRKMQRKIAKERAQARNAADMERHTIYWVVFEPRTDVQVPPQEKNYWIDPWRIRFTVNPQNDTELINQAIATFERKFNIKSWRELAVRYYVDGLYFP
jgi:hypothetical protein